MAINEYCSRSLRCCYYLGFGNESCLRLLRCYLFLAMAMNPANVCFPLCCSFLPPTQTRDPKACLAIFATNPNARKVDLQQWTIMTMEAANTAVNESYTLTKSMEKANFGNDALNQCLEVFADSLDQLNTSMYLVADMNLHAPGNTGVDVQTFMSAAMTDQDTCLQGISEVGGWPGSDAISGARADRVNTLLSISLSFVDALTKSLVDPNHHRRLLEIELQQEVALGRRGGLRSFQTLQRLGELVRKL